MSEVTVACYHVCIEVFLFFLKEKAANEIETGVVGGEMCKRDTPRRDEGFAGAPPADPGAVAQKGRDLELLARIGGCLL